MPDFDKNLQPIIKDSSIPFEHINIGAPRPAAPINVGSSDFNLPTLARNDKDVFAILDNISKTTDFNEKGVFVTSATLKANQRYKEYNPIIANQEDFAAYGQGSAEKAFNGVLKGANLVGTTIAGGFGMLYGAGKAILPGGKFSDIWDNPIMQGLDEWNNKVDQEYLPNYYTDKEKNADWYERDNWMTTNFLFDKLIKNSGFAVGAMVSGNIANGVLGAAGAALGGLAAEGAILAEASQAFKLFTPLLKNTSRAFSSAKNIEAAAILEKNISSIADLATKSSKLANLAKSTNAFAGFNDAARRTAIAAYSSAGEASFEALQTSNEYKKSLIQKYTNEHGYAPTGIELENINDLTASVGATSFLGNMALLTITEFQQLPNLLGSSYKTTKNAANGLLGNVEDAVLKNGKYVSDVVVPTTKFGKLYSSAKRVGGYMFDPKEGAQEIGQYALQVGTQHYFEKGRQNRSSSDVLDAILESAQYGLFDEKKGALRSKEGIEGGIMGALTGGVMQSFGPSGTITQNKQKKTNTETFINGLNDAPTFQQAFLQRMESINRGVALQGQYQDAVVQGDKLEALDAQTDLMHNYLTSRINYGRFDMVIEDIVDLKQMGISEEGLATLKEQGIGNVEDTVESFQKRLNSFEQVAKNTNEIIKSTNLRFSGEVLKDEEGKPMLSPDGKQIRKYSPYVIDKMVYAASKIADYDLRIPSVNTSLVAAGVNTIDVLQSIIKNNKPNREATDEVLKQINEMDVLSDVKDALKTALTDVIELSLRRKTFMQEYDDIKRKPLNYETKPEFAFGESEELDVKVEQQEKVPGKRKPLITEKELEVNKEYSLKEPLRKEGTTLQLAPKITVLSQTLGGEFEVRLPNGQIKFLTPTEFKEYNISDEDNTSEEMSDILDKAIDTVLDREEYLSYNIELKTAKLEDVLDKRAFINDLDNQKLIDAIEKEFNQQAKELIERKEKQLAQQKQLIKNKEQLTKEQAEIENNSGTVVITTDTSVTPKDEAGAIVDANIFFQSGTTESEDYNDPTLSAQHVKNSREFLNNIDSLPNKGSMRAILVTPGQESLVGLGGLTKLSYGEYDMSTALDPENGFIGQVFIVQEEGKSYFIDKTGDKIGEVGKQLSEVDMKRVIFQTMRTTKTTDSKGNPRFRGKQQELFEAYKKEYIKFREDLIANQNVMPAPFEFTVSRGIPIENKDANGVKERNHVGGILIDKDKIGSQENLIVIPTTESIFHNGQSIKFPNGTPVLQYGSTLQFLNNKKFNTKEASTIFQVVKAFAVDTLAQSESGAPIRLNRDYSDYLQNVLYWRAGQTKTNNQININTSAMTIQIGGKEYSMSEIANNEKEIVDNLKEAFNAINNTTLTKKFDDEFLEYTLDKNGELNKEPIEWKNYQTYLLSDKNPDGSARAVDSTPLTTSVAAPTANLPYSFKQRYATIESMGLSIPIPIPVVAPVVEGAPAVEKIGEYIIGNDTPNTYTLSGDRPVIFTATIDENGKVSVQIESNDTTRAIATNKTADGKKVVDQVIIPALKNIALENEQAFDLLKTDEEYVFDYLGNTIASDLQNKKDTTAAPVVEEAPIVKEKKEEVSDIEIIKERIQSLNQFLDNTDSNEAIKRTEKELKELEEKLATLEGGKKEIPTGADRFSGGPADLPGYRAVGADGNERMTDAELQLFKAWHAENVPTIPYEVVDTLITMHNGEKAWGVFENGVAKFVRGGLRGTEYHEVFEGIYKGMLSPDEQQALLDEFKAKSGTFKDRQSGKKINYADATDLQAKERIADDFSDFRFGKLPARSLGEAMRNFFSKIINFFRTFISNPSLKQDLFKAIDTGKFKERTLSPSVINEAAEYRAVEGLTEQQTREFVQDMTARAAGILYSEGEKGLLFSPDGITSNSMYDKIKTQYSNERYANGFSKIELLGDVAWTQLKEKTTISLRTLGISFNEEDKVSINDEATNKNDYAPEPFSTDWKKNSTGAIKFSLATLLEVQATNQENALSFKLPAPKVSSVVGFKLLNFTRAFATVLDKLSNTTSVTKMVNKLSDLAKDDPNYVRLFQRVGGKLSNRSVPFIDFDVNDWRYFIQFTQTFTKQKPDALIQYKEGQEVYVAPANLYTAIKQTQKGWMENIKMLASSDASLISYNKTNKTYQVDTEKIQNLPIKFPQEKVDFLKEIGIDFSLEVYNKLKDIQQVSFEKAISAIKTYLGAEKDIMTITGKTLGNINGQLSKLAELYNKVTNPNQESTYSGVEGQKMGAFAENNAPSLFENEFNESNTLDELLERRPELKDVYSKGSQVLKKGGLFFDDNGVRIKEMKVSYIQGTKLIDTNKGIVTSKLSLGERFTQEINQNLDGNYYVLIPADGSTEWMMNLGNNIKLKEIEGGRAWSKINKIFKGYLKDDIALALDFANREKLKSVKDKAKELRFFKDILSEKALADINELIEDNASMETIDEYISNNTEDINASIKEYIDSTVAETRAILEENKQIVLVKPDTFSYAGLIDAFVKDESLNKSALSDKTVNDILTFANVNYIINNIEYHKVLFGDPYQFAIKKDGSLDEPKRIKSFLSPRRTTFDTPEFNTFLNQKLNKVDEINLKPTDPGYQQFKAYTNTITIKDVTIAGSLSNVISAYGKTNEADAMSWLMDGTYREIKLKNGQWSEEAEAWHQWQMAYTRQNLHGYKYTSNNLERHDVDMMKTKQPKHVIEILKPIVSGNKYGKNNLDLVLDKFSQMPIYYSMVEGTTMEKLYTKMFNAGIGYAIVESGRKVGAEELHSLYNSNGDFNDEAFNNNIQVPWKAYGIQVETTTEGPKEQTRGSQLTKLSSMDLFDNGQTIGATLERQEAIRDEYNRNVKILNDLHQNGYNTLLRKLGVVDNGNGFTLKNGKAVSETLMYEMLRREVSDNTIDTLQLDENEQFRIPFEASPSYIEIRNILYSLIDKAIISPKMNGGAHVQVPATMFEQATKGRSLVEKVFTYKGNKINYSKFLELNSSEQKTVGISYSKITREKYANLSETDKKVVFLGDDTLKFYTKEDPYCEILLPHWFKGKLGKHADKTDAELIEYLNNTPDGKALLQGIGFRIPTQALSSVEAVRVKGFLPQYMGATVVVPSEITTKAGSDFDIDKLNMYLKSTYIDKNGDVRLIKYMGSEEATKEHYGDMFDKGLLLTKEQSKQLEEELALSKDSEYEDRLVKSMFGDLGVFSDEDIIDDFTKSLTEQGVRTTVINEMYKKSLENEYYDSLEKLVTLPENFDRLIAPIGDAGLKALSIKLDELRGYDETTIKNRMLNRNYLTSLRNSFVTAKRWVGIAAVNITNLSLKQKSEVYIDPLRFSGLSIQDEKFLGDGEIALKHNTVLINGEERISLSGITVKDSTELISDRLSGYATSFVDVAKDDYITKIIQSDLAIGTFMFLENIGAGEQGAMFVNQPIISQYLKYLNSISAKGLFNQKNIGAIKDRFVTTEANLESTPLNITNLDGNIKDYYAGTEFNTIRNAEQHKILDEFLKYAKMAEFNFKFTQATNYDTTKLRSAETLSKKQWRTQTAIDTNIINSVENILNSTFIGPQSKFLDKSTEAMGAVLKLDQLEFKEITNAVLKSFGDNEYLANDKFEKIAVEIKAAFIDYVVQNDTKYSDRIKELLIDDNTSVAVRLEIAKKTNPSLQILKELQADTGERPDGVKTIRLKTRPENATDKNMYTGMMRELRDTPATNQLYKDIVELSILQGTYASPLSIREIIPIEDYSAIVEPIISGLVANQSLDEFTKGWYQRNNFRNSDVFPIVENIKFFQSFTEEPIHTPEGDLYKYFSYSFPSAEGLGIKDEDRKILFLSEKYNFMDLKHDYVKIPRVVNGIDMVNGREVSSADYARRKAKGDYSLKDYFGYTKVKNEYGQPLIVYKKIKKEIIGHHVYKLINLYGDGDRATENYEYFKPSVIDNGSIKIDTEIPNADIINYYGAGLVKEDVVPLPAIEAPVSKKEYTEFEEVSDDLVPEEIQPKFKLMGNEVIRTEDGSTADEYNSPEEAKEGLKEWLALDKPVVKQRELFTFEKGMAQKSFRKKTLNFVDNIATTKETVVAMSNSKKTGIISINQKAMAQKFEDKAWTKPAKQLDGSFATPLAENQFSTMDEWFTFALIHEVKHDTILKQEGETTGQYEDRINQAAIMDLNKNYNVSVKVDAAELSNEYKAIDKQNVRDQLINQEYYISTGKGVNEKNVKVDENNVEDALNLKGDAELVTKGFSNKFFIAVVPNAVYNIPSGSGSIEYESIEDILSDVADESNKYLSAEEKLSAIEYLKQYGIDLSEKEFVDPNQLSLFSDETWEQEENNDTCEPF